MRLPRSARLGPCAALLLLACAAPARYVVATDDPENSRGIGTDQRLVWLTRADAQGCPGLVGLRERSNVERYGRERGGGSTALENVLYQLISGQYGAAEDTLRTRAEGLPAYLRPLLAADLAFERGAESPSTADLVRMYQAAYDAQETEMARAIVKLRIRQLRYDR